ncbi:MAG: hypothetical protein GC145_16320 [Caulobacter sp.]|nr:hypothetical protein [Caulobacter sp.]
MRRIAWLPAVLMVITATAAVSQTTWTRFNFAPDKFSINFPRYPQITESETNGLKMRTYVVDDAANMVIVAVMPVGEVPDTKQAFDAVETSRKAKGGLVLSRRDFTVQGAPASELVFRSANGSILMDRIIYREGHLYQLFTTPGPDNKAQPWAGQFYESFRFLP